MLECSLLQRLHRRGNLYAERLCVRSDVVRGVERYLCAERTRVLQSPELCIFSDGVVLADV